MMQPGPNANEIPQTVRIRLLGSFSVSVGSRNISQDEWRSKKAAALVKLLALAPGHRMHREQVMELLWPDSATKAASNNLRQVVYGARKVLDLASGSRESCLSLKDEQIVLCPEGQLWVDVNAFVENAATARRSRDSATYRAAIDLYAGDLLPENRYEEWAEGRREELRQLYLALIIELAGLYVGREEHAMAIEALGKATSEEPTLEEAHASLMRLHALSGKPERALAQYERLREALQKDLGIRPTEATRRLRDEITAGRLPSSAYADPIRQHTSDGAKHNLPAPRTSFVGREREMLEVKRALAMTRLLTLTGAGGSGKTRLSLEVARDLVGSYPDGVWFVELAPITESGLVAQEVASTLGVQEHPSEPLTDTLVDTLAAKEMLLVLDNCEHLVEGAARLVDTLLASCPRLRVLATSREPLSVSGEINWAVPTLSLPGDTTNGGLTAQTLMRYEAVRLFLDRAHLRVPDFELTQENAGAVARVCRKLDGMPLAIELATARMGALAVEQVAQRLEVSLDVLKSTSRSASLRQQTLRATLDWSHDLLSKDERVFFRRLSAFAGGWTLEAAEAVCSGDDIERKDVLDLLGGLVDKSLVVVGPHTGGAVRYGMLELIRQYALEKLEHSGEAETVRYWHAEYFLALAEEAEMAYLGPKEREWLDRLDVEHDNLGAALSWSLEDKDSDLGLRLAAALVWFWHARGYYTEGARQLEKTLTAASATDNGARAKALRGLAQILMVLGDLRRAQVYLEESLSLYKELANRAGIAETLASLGWVAQHWGEAKRAESLFEESLAIGRPLEHKYVIPSALTGLAWLAADDGDLGRTKSLYEVALALYRELDSSVKVSGTLFMTGYIELAHGNAERATTLLEEALALSREVGDKGNAGASLLGLGIAATLRGESERAEELLKQSLMMEVELGTGSKADIAEIFEGLAGAALELEKPLRVGRLWGAAEALREVSSPWSSTERLLHEPQLIAARSRLAEALWEAAFAEGRAMTFEEAVAYALHEEDVIQAGAVDGSGASDDQPLVVLTSREREVALLVSRGLTNRQIASELRISERTAGNHVAKILRKLGLRSRAQIGALVVKDRPHAPPRE